MLPQGVYPVEGPGGINAVKLSHGYYSNYPVYASVIDSGGQVFNVKSFGAKGNGTTDDSLAFNTAIIAAALAAGTVLIPNSVAPYVLNPSTLANISVNFVGQSINGVVLKIVGGYNTTNDFIRVVSQTSLQVGNFTIDGNKTGQSSGTNYGLYLSTSSACRVFNIYARNCSGVGAHFYNNSDCVIDSIWGTANVYHGIECEQNTRCTFANLHGFSNTLHGCLVDPGEVGGTGSHGNTFTNLEMYANGNYGLAFNAANGDVSAWLSEGDIFNNVVCYGNTYYGLNIYKQDKQTFNGVYCFNNGYFGVYLFESQYNTFNGIFLHNNSQAGAGAYDELFLEGYSSNNAHPSLGNVFNGGQILITGSTKARYCFNEGTSSDGPNTFVNINTPFAGTSGTVNQVCPSDIISMPGGVVQIGNWGQSIQGAMAGFDSAFANVLRLYNNFPGGNTQIVTPNGSTQFFAGGNHVVDITSTGLTVNSGYSLNATVIPGFTTTATAAGTTTMTSASTPTQVWTGTTTQTIKLPTTNIVAGEQYLFINNSTGTITIQSSNAGTIFAVAGGRSILLTALINTPVAAIDWTYQYSGISVASGKAVTFSNGGTINVNGKTFASLNNLTIQGTDGTTLTFPTTNATMARTDAAQTFTGNQTFANTIYSNNVVTVTTNAGTCPATSHLNTFTNSSAATMAITLSIAGAVDGQIMVVRVYDFSAVAQTIGWTNTENSSILAPLTSNGSTTAPLSVTFMYNAQTSLWRCIGVA